MAHSKSTDFPERLQLAAELFKALAHPARLAILELLAARTSCVCGDIALELPLAQSTVSQHLAVLKEAGLVQGEVEPPRICYCLSPSGAQLVSQNALPVLDALARPATPDCC